MRSRAAALLLALSLGLSSVAVRAAELPIEEAVETDSKLLSVPTAVGRIVARECVGCPEHYLELTGDTQFFLGSRALSFAEFSEAMKRPAQQPVVVLYRPEAKTVTRIVIGSDD